MGQIIGGAAKSKRCNLDKLSQLGTPAAGEHILVSSDNSMNAAGQGNFDCYIVGDGQKAASALPLQRIDAALEEEVSQLDQEINGLNVTITEADVTSVSGRWANNNGVIGTASSGALHRADAIDLNGITSFNLSTYMSWAATDAAYLCDDSGNILDTIPRLPSPGDPTVITGKAVPTGVTKLYINFASTFIFEGVSPGLEEKFDDKLQEFEGEVESQIDAKVESATAEAIDDYQEQYGAREIADNTDPMSLSEDDFVSGNLDYHGNEVAATSVIRSGFIDVISGAGFDFSTLNNYRANLYLYTAQKTYISHFGWQTGTYHNLLTDNTAYIRIVVASPSGVTTAPVWEDAAFSLVLSKAYKPTRAAAESEVEEIESQIDSKVDVAVDAAIDEYQKEYGAVEIVENSTPMPLTENDFVLGNLNNQGAEISANNVIRSDYIRIVPGANYTFSTVNNYRCRIYCFDKNKNYITSSAIPWQTGTYQGILLLNADYIRILVASPAGTTIAPVWANIELSFTISKVYQYGRAAAESQIETTLGQYFNIELPILGPSPQLPADGETGSDFNAETMTSMEIQSAIESQIDKLSVPNVGVNPYTPKYGTIYETIGKDASGLYDIKAYVFTRRNRFAWRASAALYAWKYEDTTYYTDHRSPLVGDTVYSDNTRTDSGYTVTAYNSAGPSITVNGNTYTRDDSARVDATDIFTQSAPSATTTSIAAYNKAGVSVGTATVSSPTQIVIGGKTYTRLSSGDFHTENKATIVIWGNEHGPQSDPNEPSIIIYRLIKDLCECGGGEFMKFLRKYCKFVFIPAANPYGINKFVSDGREGRTNFNNVNINRNYDTVGWGEQADSNKGSYAGDQTETQFIMNTVLDVAADIAIDVHCLGYNSTPLNEGRTHYEGYVSILNGKVADTMVGYCGHSYTSYGDADPSTKATGADWIYSLGIAGGLIEMNAGPYAVSYDGKQHKAGIMFTDYTLLLNTLRMWYYNFDSTLDLSRMSIK